MEVPAGTFEAQRLELMDLVQSSRTPIAVTKRGKPVARLVPMDEDPPPWPMGACSCRRSRSGRSHGDPADRLVVATARRHGAWLVTRDRKPLIYGQAGHAQVAEA